MPLDVILSGSNFEIELWLALIAHAKDSGTESDCEVDALDGVYQS